jgi:hypothetical protein
VNAVLSKTEIAEFTRAKTRGKQRRVLVANGIRHYVDGDGWPIVTRAAIEGATASAQDAAPAWKPNKAA